MASLVNINGEIQPPTDARISAFDRGFLFGDGIYETLRTWRGKLLLPDEHLARLESSAARLFLPLPGGVAGVRREVERTVDAAGIADAYVRLIVTRGAAPGVVDLDPRSAGASTLVVIVLPLKPLDPSVYAKGVDLAVVSVRRTGRDALDPAIKSGNYLNNMLALHEARERGAFECLMLSGEGFLTEGSTSNVFLVKDGVVRTPSLECGLLAGVTRAVVLDVARRAGIAAREEKLAARALAEADEAFLTSTLKDLLPVTAVDGRPVGTGKPGPVTRRLTELYLGCVRPGAG